MATTKLVLELLTILPKYILPFPSESYTPCSVKTEPVTPLTQTLTLMTLQTLVTSILTHGVVGRIELGVVGHVVASTIVVACRKGERRGGG